MNKLLLGLLLFFALPVYTTQTGCVKGDCGDGVGTYYWPSGNHYEGQFRDGKRNGQGTFYYAKSGNRFEGQYKDGKRNGQGTRYYAWWNPLLFLFLFVLTWFLFMWAGLLLSKGSRVSRIRFGRGGGDGGGCGGGSGDGGCGGCGGG